MEFIPWFDHSCVPYLNFLQFYYILTGHGEPEWCMVLKVQGDPDDIYSPARVSLPTFTCLHTPESHNTMTCPDGWQLHPPKQLTEFPIIDPVQKSAHTGKEVKLLYKMITPVLHRIQLDHHKLVCQNTGEETQTSRIPAFLFFKDNTAESKLLLKRLLSHCLNSQCLSSTCSAQTD